MYSCVISSGFLMILRLYGELGSSIQRINGSWLALLSFCWPQSVRFVVSQLFNSKLPTHILASVLVMSLTYLVMYTMSILSYHKLATLSNCTVALSMGTNLLATLLIAYKLWLVDISLGLLPDDCLFLTGTIKKPGEILV